MNIIGSFLSFATKRASSPAVSDPSLSLTYRQLAGWSMAMARAVDGQAKGQFVGIAMPACAAFPAAYFGILMAGRVPVPLNFMLEPATLAAIVKDAGLDVIIAVGPLAEPLRGLVPSVLCAEEVKPDGRTFQPKMSAQPDDLATLLYTSGTAGPPKGVMLTHRNLLVNVDSSRAMADYTPADVSLGLLPLFHAFGLTTTMLLPLLTGACAAYLPKFAPAAALKLIGEAEKPTSGGRQTRGDRTGRNSTCPYRAEKGATCIFAVPSMYRFIVQAATASGTVPVQSRLRFCVSGGEALGRETADAFQKVFGRPLLEGYGMTEASPVVSMNPPDAVRLGTVGKPLSWATLRIADERGDAQPPGVPGELWIRGECVMPGYYNRPDDTRQAIRDGWLHTGDIAALDADGYLSITGRAKEMIISAGENIAPGEIESVLNSHPAVLESAVLPAPDPSRGEVPEAYVVLKPGQQATADDLIEHCRQRLARIKVPRRVHFREELPHTLTGKILKRAIR